MSYCISIVPVAPMRSEPSHRSEQVSQLLFGEACEVLETTDDFSKVKCLYDEYEGWCQTNQLARITNERATIQPVEFAAEWINPITINGAAAYVPFGSPLSIFTNDKLSCPNFEIAYKGKKWESYSAAFSADNIKDLSHKFLNTSYLWGGKSVFGVDCSGFCQLIFKLMNLRLLRDASQQATQGESIGFLQEAQCGDLAFFDNDQGKITHVGILLNESTIIHSSGKVRIDKIDGVGIISSDTGVRTHNLRIIKRIGELK